MSVTLSLSLFLSLCPLHPSLPLVSKVCFPQGNQQSPFLAIPTTSIHPSFSSYGNILRINQELNKPRIQYVRVVFCHVVLTPILAQTMYYSNYN